MNMFNDELTAELTNAARRRSLEILNDEQTERLLEETAQRFSIDANRIWWWENLAGAITVPYEEDHAWAALDRWVDRFGAKKLVLVATGDEAPPWLGVRGNWPALRDLLKDLPYFEFFIVDDAVSAVIFDTHHNALVMAGEIVAGPSSPS